MSVVLITGASTGIGALTAVAVAKAGHTVYASMRDPEGRNSANASRLRASAAGSDLRVVELDVQSQESADRATAKILADSGELDVVVHNAGHLTIGYAEAFTAEDIAHLFDINVFGMQRVNRAVLPHLRAKGRGTLLYVSSTTVITSPPFMGPYVASKAAFDFLALCTSMELNPLGIETSIVLPGAFTQGTSHFPNASRASDTSVNAAYAALDPLVARTEEATDGLFTPGVDADPVAVADEIVRILALPFGEKPLRSVVDFTGDGVAEANDHITALRNDFVNRMGFAELLTVNTAHHPTEGH
jgi:NAD(P)-dependent dehydrogenase (short-subunit alcohol dehydrogenase family)